MKRTLVVVLGTVFLLLVFHLCLSFINIALLAPWRSREIRPGAPFFQVVGAIHIHSRYSDGSGSFTTIINAAQANGLDFLWLTDHNTVALQDSENAVTKPIVLVGSELSLKPGHLLVYGLPQIYSESGHGGVSGILDTLALHHGLAFIAHPYHPKIQWRQKIPGKITGIEVLNGDVEWRNDASLELLGAILAYPFFKQAMNFLIDLPRRELRLWDRLATKQPTVGIASVDAHAKIRLSKTSFWKFPTYKKIFAFIQDVLYFRQPLSGDIDENRRRILQALGRGNLNFGFAGLGDLRMASLWAESGQRIFSPGEKISLSRVHHLRLRVTLPTQFPFETHLYRNGVRIASSRLSDILWPIQDAGVYRIVIYQRRVHLPNFSRKNIPWLFSNHFYVQ